MIVDFCSQESASLNHSSSKKKKKKNDQVEVTTRFLSGKVLMFAKLSLMSFIYKMLETFCFPDEKVRKIFDKYLIEKVYIYHVLTDTDSTCLQFLFISDPISDICEKKYRDIIFKAVAEKFTIDLIHRTNIGKNLVREKKMSRLF